MSEGDLQTVALLRADVWGGQNGKLPRGPLFFGAPRKEHYKAAPCFAHLLFGSERKRLGAAGQGERRCYFCKYAVLCVCNVHIVCISNASI